MTHSNNIQIYDAKESNHYFSRELYKCSNLDKLDTSNSMEKLSNYLLRFGAASRLVLSTCNIDINTENYAYSEKIIAQETYKISINNFYEGIKPLQLEDTIEENHLYAYQVTNLENLNSVSPNKIQKLKGKVKSVKRGLPSKV